MKILALCMLPIALLAPRLSVAMDSIGQATEIMYRVDSEFGAGQFALLNQEEKKFRTKQSRFPDGRWKLTFFYGGLGGPKMTGNDAVWERSLRLADEWIQATPAEPAPYLAKANILIQYAWDARGTGYANTVTPEGWKLFNQRIAEAEKVLTLAPRIAQSDPYWFIEMETVAIAQGWPDEEFTKLYREAIKEAPTYEWIYFTAANYYLPRWYGSKEKLRQFVENAVQATQKYEGKTMYARIYWDELWALRDKTFAPGYANWSDMRQGFEDMMTQYPKSRWNLNAFAYYACLADDWPTTKKLIKQIGDQPDLRIWDSKEKFDHCKAYGQSFVQMN